MPMPLQPQERHFQCDRKVAQESRRTRSHNRLLLNVRLGACNVDTSGKQRNPLVCRGNLPTTACTMVLGAATLKTPGCDEWAGA